MSVDTSSLADMVGKNDTRGVIDAYVVKCCNLDLKSRVPRRHHVGSCRILRIIP